MKKLLLDYSPTIFAVLYFAPFLIILTSNIPAESSLYGLMASLTYLPTILVITTGLLSVIPAIKRRSLRPIHYWNGLLVLLALADVIYTIWGFIPLQGN
jgi:hypothetical protein